MKKYFTLLFAFLLASGMADHAAAQTANKQDSLALVDLYNSTDGPDWNNNAGWLKGPVKSWYRITLDQNGRVTQITLYGNNLNGTIPSSVENLTHLKILLLQGNYLSGSIPSFIGNITSLTELNLIGDQLTGDIPSSIGKLANLTKLSLNGNSLTGSIPSSIGNLTNLTQLNLSHNDLTGEIPSTIGNLINLTQLDLSHNSLTGEIPFTLGNISVNTFNNTINLSYNKLSGKVPYSLGKHAYIYIDNNRLTFDGMEDLLNVHYSFFGHNEGGNKYNYIRYYQQADIQLHQHDYTLAVSAGGTLSNNTYHWTDISNSKLDTTITGDSTFIPVEPGLYKVGITNSILTSPDLQDYTNSTYLTPSLPASGLALGSNIVKVTEVDPKFRKVTVNIVNPYPSSIRADGSIETDPSKIVPGQAVTGAATDGITKLLLVVDSDDPVKFSLPDKTDGLLSNDQKSYSTEVTGEPHNGKVVVVYQAPDGYGNGLPPNRKATISVSVVGSSVSSKASFKLITPPVVMVHGLWSDPSMWVTDGFTQFLAMSGFDKPSLADYQEYNASSFNPSTQACLPGIGAVKTAVINAIANYRNQNIVVTQVDIVAHSLGGLMTRSYIQRQDSSKKNYFKGFVHKLITIGTPYLGSPLGPLVWEEQDYPVHLNNFNFPITISDVLKWKGMSVGPALRDFGQFSSAIQAYQPIKNLKVFAILGTNKGKTSKSSGNWRRYINFNTLTSTLLDKSLAEIFRSPCDGSEMNSDLLVTTSSQRGGIMKDSLFYATDHSSSIPGPKSEATEQTSYGIKHEIVHLLLSNNSSDFAHSIPAPFDFQADCGILRKFKDTSKTQTAISQQTYSRLDSNQYIKLISPVSGSVYSQDSPDSIKLAFKAYGGLKIIDALFMIKGVGWFAPSDSTSDSVNIRLPKDAPVGNISISIIARDSTGNIFADTSHIIINPVSPPDSLSVSPSTISLDSLQRNRSIFVQGYFHSNGDTTILNLTDSTTGIIYSSQNGNKVFTVNKGGLVTAVGTGTDNLLIKYQGKTLRVPVTVSGNFGSRTMYANSIDFPSIKDQTLGNAPFGLVATATSGGDVTFSIVSGPAEIENGILTTTGLGKVTVKASQDGDAYFKAAPDVTRSFMVKTLTTNFKVSASGATCKGSSNGAIKILAAEKLNYTATITGNDLDSSYPFSDSLSVNNLTAGTYHVDISVKGYPDYKQSYDLVITEPKDLSVYVAVHPSDHSVTLNLSGARTYAVHLNDKLYTTSESTLKLPLSEGNNLLMVSTDKACQGVVKKSINISGRPEVFPNPFDKTLNVDLGKGNGAREVVAVITNMSDGRIVYNRRLTNRSGVVQLDLSGLAEGAYLLRLNIHHSKYIFKIIKIEK